VQKIPTLFVRDETVKGHPVIDQVKPECQWVLDGEGQATRKIDGANVAIINGQLHKRQKPADRDYDNASYVPCARENPADRHFYTAFDHAIVQGAHADGIYEVIGPKIQGGLESPSPQLVRIGPFDYQSGRLQLGHDKRLDIDVPTRGFAGLLAYLREHPIEGIVFHHPDGRMCKIKRRDFGLPWPVK
jgi:hypothetical protein